MDLVALQENTGQIKNPFGFDFVCTWNKRPIVLKGDGKWKTVIGPLRDHLAYHLYQKIRYQYHDEQVAKLREANRDKEARKFHVTAAVENRIWQMITGEDLPTKNGKSVEDVANEAADLTELENQLTKLDKQAKGKSSPVNVSAILDKANAEAAADAGALGVGESAHRSGAADINGKAVPSQPVDTTPLNAEDLGGTAGAVTPPSDTAITPEGDGAFAELAELD